MFAQRVARSPKTAFMDPPMRPAASRPDRLHAHAIGNQAQLRQIPGRLTVGAANDPLEHEADAAADRVMRMPLGAPAALSTDGAQVRRKCAACEEEDDKATLQRKADAGAGAGASAAPPIVNEALSEAGQPLDAKARAFYEPRFGRDFSGVRVHTGARAAQSAEAIGARAYTYGEHIVFASGAPAHRSGDRLLAHELAHVAQQTRGAVRRAPDAPEPQPAIGSQPDADPLQKPQPLPKPNAAPGCDVACGDSCKTDTVEMCPDATAKAVFAAWTTASTNLAHAIDELGKSPLSAAAQKSLKDNFNWSAGDSPADMVDQVVAKLNAASGKMSDNLCLKCTPPPCTADAQIYQARGQRCLDSNCFRICEPVFMKPDYPKGHALTHELFHRVVTNKQGDRYRGTAGYPPKPADALETPDSYASLIDDLAAKTPAPKPGAAPSAPPKPGASPAPQP